VYHSDECVEREVAPVAAQQTVEKLGRDTKPDRSAPAITRVIALDQSFDSRRDFDTGCLMSQD